jgi:hypothetical protein
LKKYIILSVLLLITLFSKAQWTNRTPSGTNAVLDSSSGGGYFANGIEYKNYADSSSSLPTFLKHIPFLQLSIAGVLYYRNATASGWIPISIGGSDTLITTGLGISQSISGNIKTLSLTNTSITFPNSYGLNWSAGNNGTLGSSITATIDSTKFIPYTDTLKINGIASQTFVNTQISSIRIIKSALTGLVGNGGGDDPTTGSSSFTDTKLIGLPSRIQIILGEIILSDWGNNSSFTFNSSTGTINITPNTFTAGTTLYVNLNQ